MSSLSSIHTPAKRLLRSTACRSCPEPACFGADEAAGAWCMPLAPFDVGMSFGCLAVSLLSKSALPAMNAHFEDVQPACFSQYLLKQESAALTQSGLRHRKAAGSLEMYAYMLLNAQSASSAI